MTRAAAIALAALALVACASIGDEAVTVHIFSNQPESEQIARIGDKLDESGYRHRINYAETPGGLDVAESVIAHGDDAGAFNRAQELARLVADVTGETPRIAREDYGNHHFTAGNLGLYVYRHEPDKGPRLKVRAHLAGTCRERPVELFLRIDHSYRLEHRAWRDDYTLVDAGNEQGQWQASGSGYQLHTAAGHDWFLEPPLDGDPAAQVFFVREHPEFDGCRLAEPL